MEPLIRFAILVAAIVLIPWLASVTPQWNAAWVQAWGSVGAIGSGFALILLQNHWQQNSRRDQEAEARRYYIDLATATEIDLANSIDRIEESIKSAKTVAVYGRRSNQDVSADELFTANIANCGSATFVFGTRKAANWCRSFGDLSDEIRSNGGAATAAHLKRGKEIHEVVKATLIDLQRLR